LNNPIVSPELRFVAACCCWPDDDARRRRIEVAADDVPDWTRVVDLARAHRVEGLVAYAIRQFEPPAPASVTRWALDMRDAMRAQTLLEVGETLRLCDALKGIELKILKGAPLGVRAYGRAGVKRSWDIDVLVDRSDAVEAARRIASLGYSPSKPPRLLDRGELRRWSSVSKHANFTSPRGIEVELHWRATSLPGMLPNVAAGGPVRMVDLLGDRAVPTLPDYANLAYLCVHGTSHGWSRLKWLADFSALVSGWTPDELKRKVEAAQRYKTGLSIPASFLIREQLFGFPVPQCVEVSARAAQIAALAVGVIAARSAEESIEDNRAAAAAIEQIRRLIGKGPNYVARYLLYRHRGTEIRALVALPQWLDWAYWLIRPYSFVHRLAVRRGRA
jgi:hypothetical protein